MTTIAITVSWFAVAVIYIIAISDTRKRRF